MSRGFRVWDKAKKQYDEIHTYFLSQEGTLWSWSTLLDDEHLQGLPDNLFIVEFDTGLKDKNGKKIYVGDIVKVARSYGYGFLPKGAKAKIEFDEKELCYKLRGQGEFRLTAKKELEVIGNIHENKESLNG